MKTCTSMEALPVSPLLMVSAIVLSLFFLMSFVVDDHVHDFIDQQFLFAGSSDGSFSVLTDPDKIANYTIQKSLLV